MAVALKLKSFDLNRRMFVALDFYCQLGDEHDGCGKYCAGFTRKERAADCCARMPHLNDVSRASQGTTLSEVALILPYTVHFQGYGTADRGLGSQYWIR